MFSGLQDGTYDLGICGSTAMSYPLWMSGYYDNKNATYCQITELPHTQSFRIRSLLKQTEAKKKNW
ncbi:MAG: hypothetical protein ACLR78_03255 [Roseburia sp.]